MMICDNIQNFFKALGKSGCYVFCLIAIAQREKQNEEIDILDAINEGITSGAIYFNKLDYLDSNNFFVNDPCKFLEQMTGRKWSVEKTTDFDKAITCNAFAVHYFTSDIEGVKIGHFVTNFFDSALGSRCVTNGKWESARLFRKL